MSSEAAQRNPPKLLDRVREAIRVRHYSRHTEAARVHWIRRYILVHNRRHPSAMGTEEVNRFLSHLATDCDVAASAWGWLRHQNSAGTAGGTRAWRQR